MIPIFDIPSEYAIDNRVLDNVGTSQTLNALLYQVNVQYLCTLLVFTCPSFFSFFNIKSTCLFRFFNRTTEETMKKMAENKEVIRLGRHYQLFDHKQEPVFITV